MDYIGQDACKHCKGRKNRYHYVMEDIVVCPDCCGTGRELPKKLPRSYEFRLPVRRRFPGAPRRHKAW